MESHAAPSTARGAQKPGDEEAGADLRLGEFHGVPTLSLSEARLLITAVMDHRRADAKKGAKVQETETLIKIQDYLDVFARFKQKENIEAVERLLATTGSLDPFERSQLGTLCCETAEEAKTLIPSITHKISDADLQDILNEISKLRNFVE
ncbi:hypothetical protein BDY21DRAFT_281199 [Lineolata rhizophorae]|uniref:RNA polymerase Rpb4/RPC9 core domain-containing protein n=1 Tax=Lineolata rhizophorae TaxID=578093 RepID=A0A6A6P8D3_9PEZI|nr:hypothetical protein BDY21DRAFT_281199 [Lineolata rhizophorae]